MNQETYQRYIIAGNPNTPGFVLSKLANDTSEIVRRHAAENPRLPAALLCHLACDPSDEVRSGIVENVARRQKVSMPKVRYRTD